MMYGVVCYFNYRKNQNVKFLKTFFSLSKAVASAKDYASDKYDDVIDHVIIKQLLLNDCIYEFTEGTGYEKYVYAVVRLPEIYDGDEFDPNEDPNEDLNEDLNEYPNVNDKYADIDGRYNEYCDF
jgi:hypothetical protein